MITEGIRQRAALVRRTIAFADASDHRVLAASRSCADNGTCVPILVGSLSDILSTSQYHNISLDALRIIDPASAHDHSHATDHVLRNRGNRITVADASSYMRTDLAYAGWLVSSGIAHGAVAGATSTTASVIKAGLWTIGLRPGLQTVSSYFLMEWPNKTLLFTDAGVVPQPSAEQLADIAEAAAENFILLVGRPPRIAFLSFSTKGSAEHPSLQHVRQGALLLAARRPDLAVDGELQADAALVPEIAQRKSPGSPVGGNADILVFPDLNSGNIAYKLCERLGGATAIGPIVQGLAKPYCDLSRGCSIDDIITVAAVTAVMCG